MRHILPSLCFFCVLLQQGWEDATESTIISSTMNWSVWQENTNNLVSIITIYIGLYYFFFLQTYWIQYSRTIHIFIKHTVFVLGHKISDWNTHREEARLTCVIIVTKVLNKLRFWRMKNYILHEVIQYEIIHRPMIHQEFMTINTSRIPIVPFFII